jgi:hypothetical protein
MSESKADPSEGDEDEKEEKDEPTGSRPTPLDTFAAVESSWGYPAFARDFPRHPELDALVAAFARGDYHTVRERAPKLAKVANEASDEGLERAALLLRQRIDPDPAAKTLFAIAAALIVVLTAWWIMHAHHAP